MLKYFIAGIILFISGIYLYLWYMQFDTKVSQGKTGEIRYVALGDSYTEGTNIDPQYSYPTLLTNHLKQEEIPITLVANLGRSGWNSNDVVVDQLPQYDRLNPTFATILIGANDIEQGISEETFKKNLGIILNRMQAKLAKKDNIIVITIPDFSVTLVIKQYENPRIAYGKIAGELKTFNAIIKEEAAKRNLKVVDITQLSRDMENNPKLRAVDQLHPSAKEYALWEELIYPVAFSLLAD